MKKTVQDANIPWDHSIIAAVSDKDVKNSRRLETVNFGYQFIFLGGLLIVSTIFIIVDCIIKRDKKRTCYDTLKLTYHS